MGRRLGQHFLRNKGAVTKIIRGVLIEEGETIIEIGPGKGALTLPLLAKCKEVNAKLIVIERDEKLVSFWEEHEDVTVYSGDAVSLLPEIIAKISGPYRIVGNIPYYITGSLLRVLSEITEKPRKVVLMVQREVARRLNAAPGQTNLLSASVQFWAETEILFELPPGDFSPPPAVHSAVIALAPRSELFPVSPEDYYKFLKVFFMHPRKTLRNNILPLFESGEAAEAFLAKYELTNHTRAAELSVKKIVELIEDLR